MAETRKFPYTLSTMRHQECKFGIWIEPEIRGCDCKKKGERHKLKPAECLVCGWYDKRLPLGENS